MGASESDSEGECEKESVRMRGRGERERERVKERARARERKPYLTICSETALFWNLAGRSRMGFTVKHWMSSNKRVKETHHFSR